MIGKTVSHYTIIRKLGAGGMGEVYLAEDTELGRRVALKFLPPGYSKDPDVLARFRREAQAAAGLDHPNIITIHNVAMYDDRPYIVMAHVKGAPLGDYVKSKSPTLKVILDLAIQIGEGLAKAHGAGIVHRDLKPDNILIDGDGRPKILDFGLAKLAGVTRITREDSTVGTIYYMSPEQTRGEDVDHRSDIFSLGTVLYEMIAHRLPFEGDHTSAVMYSIVHTEPQPLARYNKDASHELESIVSKMLAKDPAERYQSAADLVADLKRERRVSDDAVSAEVQTRAQSKSNLVKIGLPAVVAVAIAIFFILKPFRVEITPDQTATASENSLAVMYFENMTDRSDEERHGEIIANLVITALSDENHLRVISSQRLYDILKALDKEGARVIDRNTATRVAERAGAHGMLLGSILQIEPMVVTYQLVDVASGDVMESRRIDGREGETVFSLVDRMSASLKQDLALPTADGEERSVAAMTTSSPDAYRLYLEGVELLNKNYKIEAINTFKAVLAIDSTMAMAATRLATPNMEPLSARERMVYARQAHRHRHRVGERDRHMINAAYAIYFGTPADMVAEMKAVIEKAPDDKEALYGLGMVYWRELGDREQAIHYLRKVVEVDPGFKLAHNSMAYVYMGTREYHKALEALDRYIVIAPEEPNPYDSRAEVYALMGRLDDAIIWYKKALEIKPNFGVADAALAGIYLYRREYVTAEPYIRNNVEAEYPGLRSFGRYLRAVVPAMQGKLRETLATLDRGIAQDEAEGFAGLHLDTKYWMKSQVHSALGDHGQALAAGDRALDLELANQVENQGISYDKVELLALAGDLSAAEAWLESHPLGRADPTSRASQAYAEGTIDFYRGDYQMACERFETAAELEPMFYYQYLCALAYLKAGRTDDAVAAYRKLVHAYGLERQDFPLHSTWVHYYAGIAYEAAGRVADAITEYEHFLGFCGGADPEFDGVADARERLKGLRQGL